MRFSYRFLRYAFLCLLFSPLAYSSEKLTLNTENYPPFNMSAEGKNFSREPGIKGISVEIVQEMMKRSGIEYSMNLRSPWERIFHWTQEKANRGLFSTTFTEERKPLFKWVGPLVSNDWAILQKQGSNFQISSLDDLKDYRVGSYRGDSVAEYLKEHHVPVIEAVLDKHNAEKLEAGRIDLWASSRLSAPYISQSIGLSHPEVIYTFKSIEYYLALNLETSDAIVARLQKALDSMKADGTVDKIIAPHL